MAGVLAAVADGRQPAGATPLSRPPANVARPSGIAAIAGALPPKFYLSEGGPATLTLDCRPVSSGWPFHRCAAAAILLLSGVVSAGIFARRVRIGRIRRFC